MRDKGLPFNTLSSGEIANQLRLRVTNRTDHDDVYTLSIVGPDGVRIEERYSTLEVKAGKEESIKFPIFALPRLFPDASVMIFVRVTNSDGSYTKDLKPFKMHGPYWKEDPDE